MADISLTLSKSSCIYDILVSIVETKKMTAWIDVSSRWELTSVQAALNVIISVLGTVGLWAITKHWWQQGRKRMLSPNSNEPLPKFLTVSGLGDVWDVFYIFRKKAFTRGNWHLLFQVAIVVIITALTMFAGPIAKVSLTVTKTIQQQALMGLQAIKGDGDTGNLLNGDVSWNQTIQSLDQAEFPLDQLLDYLPPTSSPWKYFAAEWTPTWKMSCNPTEETAIANLQASGNVPITRPFDAFPAFKTGFDPIWFNTSQYRTVCQNAAWIDVTFQKPFRDAMFFCVTQSDPLVEERLETNNSTLKIIISVFHLQGFTIANIQDVTWNANPSFVPIGSVDHASYAKVECEVTRSRQVDDESMIPWIWTNDTQSIVEGLRTSWSYDLFSTLR